MTAIEKGCLMGQRINPENASGHQQFFLGGLKNDEIQAFEKLFALIPFIGAMQNDRF